MINTKLLQNGWKKYYKKGFFTGIIFITFICLIDQILLNPFFFSKINSSNIFLTLSFIFFGSVFCGILSLIFLFLLSFISVSKN